MSSRSPQRKRERRRDSDLGSVEERQSKRARLETSNFSPQLQRAAMCSGAIICCSSILWQEERQAIGRCGIGYVGLREIVEADLNPSSADQPGHGVACFVALTMVCDEQASLLLARMPAARSRRGVLRTSATYLEMLRAGRGMQSGKTASPSDHHAKVLVLRFNGGSSTSDRSPALPSHAGPFVRVVVTSANLYLDEWKQMLQTVWVQDFPVTARAT